MDSTAAREATLIDEFPFLVKASPELPSVIQPLGPVRHRRRELDQRRHRSLRRPEGQRDSPSAAGT
jgi:hypothetical protein